MNNRALITLYNVGADDDVDYEEDEYDDYDDVDDDLYALIMHLCHLLVLHMGVVECGEGVEYLTLPGHPTDIGLQLGKLQARPAILVAGKGSGGMFLSLLFLHFHSGSSLCRPTGDQEVEGSTPAEVGNIHSWRLIMKYFLRSFSPFR